MNLWERFMAWVTRRRPHTDTAEAERAKVRAQHDHAVIIERWPEVNAAISGLQDHRIPNHFGHDIEVAVQRRRRR